MMLVCNHYNYHVVLTDITDSTAHMTRQYRTHQHQSDSLSHGYNIHMLEGKLYITDSYHRHHRSHDPSTRTHQHQSDSLSHGYNIHMLEGKCYITDNYHRLHRSHDPSTRTHQHQSDNFSHGYNIHMLEGKLYIIKFILLH